nr:hypothetical protein [Glycomyces harbinensis]
MLDLGRGGVEGAEGAAAQRAAVGVERHDEHVDVLGGGRRAGLVVVAAVDGVELGPLAQAQRDPLRVFPVAQFDGPGGGGRHGVVLSQRVS